MIWYNQLFQHSTVHVYVRFFLPIFFIFSAEINAPSGGRKNKKTKQPTHSSALASLIISYKGNSQRPPNPCFPPQLHLLRPRAVAARNSEKSTHHEDGEQPLKCVVAILTRKLFYAPSVLLAHVYVTAEWTIYLLLE